MAFKREHIRACLGGKEARFSIDVNLFHSPASISQEYIHAQMGFIFPLRCLECKTMNSNDSALVKRPKGFRLFLRGCAVGCLTTCLFLAAGFYGAYRVARGRYPSLTERLRAQGYEVVRGQFIEVRDPIASRTVFFGQHVRVLAGSSRGIAVVAQTAELDGAIEGNVYFVGQQLTIARGATLKHHLHVVADQITKSGRVEGELRGYYRELQD